jgi:hypothetical protein
MERWGGEGSGGGGDGGKNKVTPMLYTSKGKKVSERDQQTIRGLRTQNRRRNNTTRDLLKGGKEKKKNARRDRTSLRQVRNELETEQGGKEELTRVTGGRRISRGEIEDAQLYANLKSRGW